MQNYNCQHCGQTMAYIDYNRSPFCRQNACQRARVQVEIREHKTVVNGVIQQSVESHKSKRKSNGNDNKNDQVNTSKRDCSRRDSSGPDSSKAIVAILPFNDKALVELPEERKEAFIAHLKRVYQSIGKQHPSAETTYVAELSPPDDDLTSTLLGKACATCKGACCGLGESHAFQDYWSLERYMSIFENTPSEEAIVDNYRKFLPRYSYQSACVFQGELGCTLPSEMRAITCRNYKCDGLTDYENKLRGAKSGLTHAAGTRGRNVLNISVFDEVDTEVIPIIECK